MAKKNQQKKTLNKKQPRYDTRFLVIMMVCFLIMIVGLILSTDRSRFYEKDFTYITEKIQPTNAVIDIACYTHDKKVISNPTEVAFKLTDEFYPFVLKLYNDKIIINKFIQVFDMSLVDSEIGYPDNCRAGNSHITFSVTHIINGMEMDYSITCNHNGDEKDRKSVSIIMDEIEQSFKSCIETYVR